MQSSYPETTVGAGACAARRRICQPSTMQGFILFKSKRWYDMQISLRGVGALPCLVHFSADTLSRSQPFRTIRAVRE